MAIEPKDLLPHFEREMTLLRRSMQTFAQRFPKVAARLAITGGHSDDPHVERLLQSFALMAACHDVRLDDDVPAFTHSFLDALYGVFLRPFPSCAIAQFHGDFGSEPTGPRVVPRGDRLIAPIGKEVFRIEDDIAIAPLTVSVVRYTTSAVAPRDVALPPETTGLLTFTFELTTPTATFGIVPDRLRLHFTGAREIVAALTDAALLLAGRGFAEADDSTRWKRLPEAMFTAVGFEPADALLDVRPDDVLWPFHLLMTYCAVPERFDFVDLDMRAIKRIAGSGRRVVLHLAIAGVHPDSHRAQRLAAATADHVRLFCAPVINLFQDDAQPIETRAGCAHYAVKALAQAGASRTAIWSIDTVRHVSDSGASTLAPFRSLQHGTGMRPGLFWMVLRDEARRALKEPVDSRSKEADTTPTPAETAESLRGVELELVDQDGRPADPGHRKLEIHLSCTQGDLSGMRERELAMPSGDPLGTISLLNRPTRSQPPAFRYGELWDLLSLLVPQAIRLDKGGLTQLRRLCARWAEDAVDAGRRFDAIVSLSTARVRCWLPGKPASAFVHGLEVRLVVDEQRFAAFSLSGFAHVMERLFAPYVPVTSFVQVVLFSAATGAPLRRGAPRPGTQPLV
ncbi:type VI secretion system baseplate subunit TssF [Burkholderia cenocepacia]|uniref:type VI secretion system baseplate subunit TssF n=1 Tax=Burkholderia cenocepacia TaxID=95486 RepID=UPI001F1CF0C3|nr:type VI secretion system baseplate subunit TssF [Burkholderia cenocepacia]MCF1370733.1 type VI secretion system baseplate subunit TssF [Burkholderia cenocepacia]MCF1387834.1 type VI secretion system baseplate subunit TssF [Burkholderia cenocepacia]